VGRERLKGLQLALRASVGASLSFGLAQVLHLDHPIFAFTAAVIVTDLKPSQTRELGLRRMGATAMGGMTGAGLSLVLPPTTWAIGASVLVGMLLADMLRAREGAKIAGYICGLIVLEHSPGPWHDALYRVMETALGVSVAWLISYVPKLVRAEEAGAEIRDAEPPMRP
jgi:uncharacterized membrane protein YgaE (UPF0421/DUF939 family)